MEGVEVSNACNWGHWRAFPTEFKVNSALCFLISSSLILNLAMLIIIKEEHDDDANWYGDKEKSEVHADEHHEIALFIYFFFNFLRIKHQMISMGCSTTNLDRSKMTNHSSYWLELAIESSKHATSGHVWIVDCWKSKLLMKTVNSKFHGVEDCFKP